MQEDMKQVQYIEEDTIDLRELWVTLMKKKIMIVVITLLVTLGAVGYAFLKTPKYEAKALLEIGNYKLNNNNNNNNNKVYLDNASRLVKKLNILFIDINKNEKNRKAKVISITAPAKENIFIEIKSIATSNEKAKVEIEKIILYVKDKHQKILDDVKKRRELEIKNLDTRIEDIKTKELKLLDEKSALTNESIKTSEKELRCLSKSIKNTEKLNTAFVALEIMQKRDIIRYIESLRNRLIDIENKKNILKSTTINSLIEQKELFASMLLPYNYKNSEVVGNIITSDYPVKPKKKLIVVVAFITGLMFSIFLVFFLEFIKSGRKEEEL